MAHMPAQTVAYMPAAMPVVGAIQQPGMPAPKQNAWSTDLCDMFAEPGGAGRCLCALIFPGCAHGQMAAIAPEMMKAHGVQADDVDECLVPMAQSFCNNWISSQIDVPLYDRWFLGANETASFRRYKDVLRLVGLNDERRWLLKNPSHVFGIDALLAVFPDACIVQTHRHPAASLASLVNLLGNVMQPEIRRDPLGVVRTIYSHFNLILRDETEAAMQLWAKNNAEKVEASHSYAEIAEQRPVLDAFAAYIERYKL